MITSAIGRPIPKAPPIICTNAESKLSSSWTSTRFDIPLLHRAPTSTARRPKNEQEKGCVRSGYRHAPEPERSEAESLWLRKG